MHGATSLTSPRPRYESEGPGVQHSNSSDSLQDPDLFLNLSMLSLPVCKIGIILFCVGLLRGLNEITHVKCLEQCLVCNKCSINVSFILRRWCFIKNLRADRTSHGIHLSLSFYRYGDGGAEWLKAEPQVGRLGMCFRAARGRSCLGMKRFSSLSLL